MMGLSDGHLIHHRWASIRSLIEMTIRQNLTYLLLSCGHSKNLFSQGITIRANGGQLCLVTIWSQAGHKAVATGFCGK